MGLLQDINKQNLKIFSEKFAQDPSKEEPDQQKLNDYIERPNNFNIGDMVKIHYKIVEGKRERIQIYEGYVISIKGKGISKTFKVRKISYGVGVERTFPFFSPNIAKIELIRRGEVRRSKLYYLRKRIGKKAAIKEKINFKKTSS